MGSASADLTKDLGGAVFQAILGALLTIAYAKYFVRAFAKLPAAQAQKLGQTAATEISSSFAGARHVAATLPGADADQLVAAARDAFTQGKTLAIAFALLAALVGVALVLWKYPHHQAEQDELSAIAAKNQEYLTKREAPPPATPPPAEPGPSTPGTV